MLESSNTTPSIRQCYFHYEGHSSFTTLYFQSTFHKILGMEDQPTPENAEISAGTIAVRASLDALLRRAEALLSEVTAFESFLHAQNRGKDAELRRFKSSVGAEKRHLQKLGDRLANSVFDPQHTGQDSLNREDLSRGKTLERFCPQPCPEAVDQGIAMDDSNVVAHSIDSSNLSWYETVWTIAKRCQGIKALQRSVSHSFQGRNGLSMESLSPGVADRKHGREKQRKQNVIVDIVAGDGLEWIKVVTITKKRLLFEMAKEGWDGYGGMSDSESDASGEDHSKESGDNGNSLKIVRLAQEMKNAASAVRVRYRHPKIRFILPNVEEGETDEIDAVIRDIRAIGIGVYCGSGDDGRYAHSEAGGTDYLHLREDTDRMFHYMLPSTAGPPPTSILNIDCTILLSLISDISHIQKDSLLATPARRYWKGVLKQVMAEATSPLLRDELYPILIGRDLVCTTEAVRRMREIAETMGTDVEKKRADIFFGSGQMAGRSPEQLGLELKAYSAHAVPEGLRLPIKVVNFDLDAVLTGSTPAKHLPVSIASNVVNHKLCLSDINRSVFFYGWDAGIVTVTSNRVVTSQIEHAIAKALDEAEVQTHRQRSEGGDDASPYSSGFGEPAANAEEVTLGGTNIWLGPDFWFSTPRSLVGKERGKDGSVDHHNTSGPTWENEMAE